MEKSLKEAAIEDLRHLPGYQSCTDEELQNIVQSIYEFAFIITNAILEDSLKHE